MSRPKNQRHPEKRDYRAEYARRIERALARGFSKAQARGHGGPIRKRSKRSKRWQESQRLLEKGLQSMRSGASLTKAAKELHVAPERLQYYVARSGIAQKSKGRWLIGEDRRPRQMLMFSQCQQLTVTVNPDQASLIGSYLNAVQRFLESNDISHLTVWQDRSVVDVKGKSHPFETNPNTLYRLSHPGQSQFEQIYRILI